jgi:hypothetical protein
VRRRGRAYLLGLLSQSERKTSWPLAEFAVVLDGGHYVSYIIS